MTQQTESASTQETSYPDTITVRIDEETMLELKEFMRDNRMKLSPAVRLLLLKSLRK